VGEEEGLFLPEGFEEGDEGERCDEGEEVVF